MYVSIYLYNIQQYIHIPIAIYLHIYIYIHTHIYIFLVIYIPTLLPVLPPPTIVWRQVLEFLRAPTARISEEFRSLIPPRVIRTGGMYHGVGI